MVIANAAAISLLVAGTAAVPAAQELAWEATQVPHTFIAGDSSPVSPGISMMTQYLIACGAFMVIATPSDDQFIAEDLDHYSYGVGSSWQAAVSDWQQALLGSYKMLQENRDFLAPHLAEELRQLAYKLQEGNSSYGSASAPTSY